MRTANSNPGEQPMHKEQKKGNADKIASQINPSRPILTQGTKGMLSITEHLQNYLLRAISPP